MDPLYRWGSQSRGEARLQLWSWRGGSGHTEADAVPGKGVSFK